MKKILITMIFAALVLTGCNYDYVDLTYSYDYAWILLPNGEVVEGEVVRLTDFGAFVDVGGVDGLLPLSQISWKWVEHPSDILKMGDKIKVEIIGVDYSKKRVSLSLKSLAPDPWETAKDNIKEGDSVEGIITRIKNFGAFVEVYDGVEALLPINEVTEYQNKNSLILKEGDKVEGVVTRIKHFGAFVEVVSGVEALLPALEMTIKRSEIKNSYQVGDTIKTRIKMLRLTLFIF